MMELENHDFPATPTTEGTLSSDAAGNTPCPEHPLGSDLFYVLRNAYRA
ncbi:hypothetical protein [Nisaea sp.]